MAEVLTSPEMQATPASASRSSRARRLGAVLGGAVLALLALLRLFA